MFQFKVIINKNIDVIKDPLFYRALVSEFLGTFFLMFVGCFSTLDFENEEGPSPNIVAVGLCFGILVAILVTALGNVSGCHINPAVTLSFLITRKICLIKAICYIIMQTIGSIAAFKALHDLMPGDKHYFLMRHPVYVNHWQALGVEYFITFNLIFIIYGVFDSGKTEYRNYAPLIIGLGVTAGIYGAGNYTGGCMNPARALGPAVLTGNYRQLWIFFWGPTLGGMSAAIIYDLFFDTGACPKKLKKFFTQANYDPTEFHTGEIPAYLMRTLAVKELKDQIKKPETNEQEVCLKT